MILLLVGAMLVDTCKIPWLRKAEDHCRDLAGVELADAMKELALQRSNKVGVVYAGWRGDETVTRSSC